MLDNLLITMKNQMLSKITEAVGNFQLIQKSVSKNPRSTVGAITEIYDYLRLLYSKSSTAFSTYITGKKWKRFVRKNYTKN